MHAYNLFSIFDETQENGIYTDSVVTAVRPSLVQVVRYERALMLLIRAHSAAMSPHKMTRTKKKLASSPPRPASIESKDMPIRYAIRYDILTWAQKLTTGQLSLAYGAQNRGGKNLWFLKKIFRFLSFVKVIWFLSFLKNKKHWNELKTNYRSRRRQAGRRLPPTDTHAQTDGQPKNIMSPVPSVGCAGP